MSVFVKTNLLVFTAPTCHDAKHQLTVTIFLYQGKSSCCSFHSIVVCFGTGCSVLSASVLLDDSRVECLLFTNLQVVDVDQ